MPTVPPCGVVAHNDLPSFLRGSGDGEVEVLAAGKLHLQKKITGLGAFSAPAYGATVPEGWAMGQSGPVGWAYGSQIYVVKRQGNIYSAPLDALGHMAGDWSLRGALPWTYSVSGLARWMDKLYVAPRAPTAAPIPRTSSWPCWAPTACPPPG